MSGTKIHIRNSNINSELIKKIKTGNIIEVKKLLEKPIDQSELNKGLIFACHKKNVELIKLLVSSGADIHHDSESVLEKAIMTNDKSIIDLVFSLGANIKILSKDMYKNILSRANGETVNTLINYGFEVNMEMLKYTILYDNLSAFKVFYSLLDVDWSIEWPNICKNYSNLVAEYVLDLLPNDFPLGNTHFYNLIGNDINSMIIIKKILNRLSDPTLVIDINCLKEACLDGQYEIVKIILELGINPNTNKPILGDSELEMTTMECALSIEKVPDIRIFKLLLDYDTDVTSSCLSLALAIGDWEIFKLIYQERYWTIKELSDGLIDAISMELDSRIYQFLHKEIGAELEKEYLKKIINDVIGYDKEFKYFANFYGKGEILELIEFDNILKELKKRKKNKTNRLDFLIKFYGRETIRQRINFEILESETKEILKSIGLVSD